MVIIRPVDTEEIPALFELLRAGPDPFLRRAIELFPPFVDAWWTLEPPNEQFRKQDLVLGAYLDDQMVGAVMLQRFRGHSEPQLPDKENQAKFLSIFSVEEARCYDQVSRMLLETFINPPAGALLINSLQVLADKRGEGIGSLLIDELIRRTDTDFSEEVYVELATRCPMQAAYRKRGFVKEKETSFVVPDPSNGYWEGSVLLRRPAFRT